MRWACCLIGLAACSQAPAPAPMTPSSIQAESLVCSPDPQLPEVKRPECPQPPEHVPMPWHCFDWDRPKMELAGYCYTSPSSCNSNRETAKATGVGKTTECVAQDKVSCFIITDKVNMWRQLVCARRAEGCERRRRYAVDNRQTETSEHGPCEPTLNTAPYNPEEFSPVADGP